MFRFYIRLVLGLFACTRQFLCDCILNFTAKFLKLSREKLIIPLVQIRSEVSACTSVIDITMRIYTFNWTDVCTYVCPHICVRIFANNKLSHNPMSSKLEALCPTCLPYTESLPILISLTWSSQEWRTLSGSRRGSVAEHLC